MNKNVFAKSILRQRVRSLLLLLLIGLAAFVFVLRTVEYIVVRNQINEIAGFYRSVGILFANEPFGDVSAAVDIIEGSPAVSFVDYRRIAEGILQDFRNGDIDGAGGGTLANRVRRTDAFMITTRRGDVFWGGGVAMRADPPEGVVGGFGSATTWTTSFDVQDMLVGYEEHVFAGRDTFRQQRLLLTYITHPGGASVFEDMTWDYQYFVRAIHIPQGGNRENIPMHLIALNAELPDQEPIWYIRLARGEVLDLHAHGLGHLYELMGQISQNQHAMVLRTTSDMMTMPQLLGDQPLIRINSGRPINHTDYTQANHVAVINAQFARHRGLDVGDILRISIPATQRFDRIYSRSVQLYAAEWVIDPETMGLMPPRGTYLELLVTSEFETEPTNVLELEIVGTYQYLLGSMSSRQTLPIYIPDSILPTGFTILPPLNPAPNIAHWTYGHMPDNWVSFVLTDSRYEQAFLAHYAPIFAEMGIDLVIIGADSSNFWATAAPILTIVTFNAVLFWIVLALVFALAAFLFLRGNVKIFAISRALGMPSRVVLTRSCVSFLLLCLPAIVIGGYAAWLVGLATTTETLMPLAEMVEGIEIAATLHIAWFIILTGFLVTAILLMIAGGAAFVVGRPVLELLQGNFVRKKRRKKQTREKKARLDWLYSRLGHNTGWVLRHIIRQPVKTALGIVIAMFFILALSWIQEAISRGHSEVDRLFDSTIVYVDVRPSDRQSSIIGPSMSRIAPGFHVGAPITARLVDNARNLSFVENVYTESAHARAFVLPETADGNLPDNWAEIIGYDLTLTIDSNLHTLDFLYAFNDFDKFVFEHSRGFDDRFIDDIYVEFYHGFDGGLFALDAVNDAVPIVVYAGTMQARGLRLGDTATLVYTRGMLSGDMPTTQVFVVGVHNGRINRELLTEATLLPTAYLDRMLGHMGAYVTFNFTINPDYNRDIDAVYTQLAAMIPGGGFQQLTLFFLDEELRNAVVAMEQSVLVLELLYPIAVALCIAIGAALAMLLLMQSNKNAAILRVLGSSNIKTQTILCVEQLVVCVIGVAAGTAIVLSVGMGFGTTAGLQLAGLYLTGSVAGLVAGAVKATSKAPIDLLQVRE